MLLGGATMQQRYPRESRPPLGHRRATAFLCAELIKVARPPEALDAEVLSVV